MFARKVVFLRQFAKDQIEQQERHIQVFAKNYPLWQPDQRLSKAHVIFFYLEMYALSKVVTFFVTVLSFLAISLSLV